MEKLVDNQIDIKAAEANSSSNYSYNLASAEVVVKAIELLVQSLNQWRSLWRLAFIGKQSSSRGHLRTIGEVIQTLLRRLGKVARCLGLSSKQETLIETWLFEKLKIASQSENGTELDYIE